MIFGWRRGQGDQTSKDWPGEAAAERSSVWGGLSDQSGDSSS